MPGPNHIIDENYYLGRCLDLIETKAGMGPRDRWTNSVFVNLSFDISRQTKISISSVTLKRLFGKVNTPDEYEPQQATKEALSMYLGYGSWKEFKNHIYQSQEAAVAETTVTIENTVVVETPVTKGRTKTLWAAAGSLFIILLIICGVYFYRAFHIQVQGKYLVGRAYHTAVFEYRISKLARYEMIVGDQHIQMDPADTACSAYLQLPDLYPVSLTCMGRRLYDTSVYLATNGWECYANVMKPDMRYFPVMLRESSLAITKVLARSSGIDTNQIWWVHYCNMKNYGVSGDDMQLESVIKNDVAILDVQCNHIRIDVIGEKGRIGLYFTKQGCSKWIRLQFADKCLAGDKADLSAFSKDFSDFRNIIISVKNKQIQVSYEGSVIFETAYTQPIGSVLGLRYSFSGCGVVRSVKLNSEVIY